MLRTAFQSKDGFSPPEPPPRAASLPFNLSAMRSELDAPNPLLGRGGEGPPPGHQRCSAATLRAHGTQQKQEALLRRFNAPAQFSNSLAELKSPKVSFILLV